MKNVGKFIMNGLILSAVALLLKTVGVAFNAFITTRLGAVGTGLYSLVTSVYAPALTLATAGVNLAASRIVAEELGRGDGASARCALKKIIAYTLTVSASVGALLFLMSGYISRSWLDTAAAEKLLKPLALGLPFVALSSAVSGYFTAVRRVSRNAAARLFEQFFKIAITVYALIKTAEYGPEACLFTVVLCTVAADGASCLLLYVLCLIDEKKLGRERSRGEGITKRILDITLPVSVSSFLRSGLVALEHILIPKGLKKSGASYESAMASYGILSGMALPIIFFPTSFLYSFTGLLIPEFAEAKEKNESESITSSAVTVIKTVLMFSVGSAAVILGFSGELGHAIYKSSEAARYIKVIAPLIPIMYLDTAVDSVLKGLGEQVFTMKVNILDAFCSVIGVWLLIPRLGLDGYIIIIFMSEIINFSFSLARLCKITGLRVRLFKWTAKPLIAGIISVAGVRFILTGILLPVLNDSGMAIVGISAAVLIYVLLLRALKVIPKKKLSRLLAEMSGKKAGDADELI